MHKLEMVRVSARNAVPTDVRWCAARSAPAAVVRAGGSNDRRLVLRFRVRPGRPSSRSRRTRCRRGPTSWLVHAALQGTARVADCEAAAAGLLSRGTNPGCHLPSRPRCLPKARLSLLLVRVGGGFGTRTQPAAHSLSRRRTKTLSSASLRDPYLAIGVSRRTCPRSERPLSHLWRRRRKKSRITKLARLIKSLCQNTKKVVKTKLLGIKSQNDDHRTRSKD